MGNTVELGELVPLTKRRAKEGRGQDKEPEFGWRHVECMSSVGPLQGDVQEAVGSNSLGLHRKAQTRCTHWRVFTMKVRVDTGAAKGIQPPFPGRAH